jgi:hypothetical protein
MGCEIFFQAGARFGLAGGNYQALRHLVDIILKASWARNSLGVEFVEKSIFLWRRDQYGQAEPGSLADYLSQKAREVVRHYTIWVPIAFMEVESGFEMGPVRVIPLTAEMMDERELACVKLVPDRAADVRRCFIDLRQKAQGLAAVAVDVPHPVPWTIGCLMRRA